MLKKSYTLKNHKADYQTVMTHSSNLNSVFVTTECTPFQMNAGVGAGAGNVIY